jgi:outer membrane protein OmpA-like peptidoglycan-associated protein
VETRVRNVPMVKGDYVMLQGTILEEAQNMPLQRAAITIIDNRTQRVVDSTMSLGNGTFTVALPWDSLANYSIIGAKNGFLSKSLHLEKREGQEMSIALALEEAKFGLEHSHKIIYYSYNGANLDLLSKKDLNEIYVFLNENMDAKLEIRSHTDARGTKQYNLELSRRRSDAVIQYIQARRQIPSERFISWGFGEEYLLNDCVDGKPCTEEEHARNRRTEIKIVER